MPVNQINYNHRGGGNFGIVLRCPNLVAGDHLVYFDHNRDRGSWVIRDFIAGERLDNNHSALSVTDIEGDATYDEFPAWCNVEIDPAAWQQYLTLRSTAVLRLSGSLRHTNSPNRTSGNWHPI
jgi:hypothetical protein